jgi:hypothetical protein
MLIRGRVSKWSRIDIIRKTCDIRTWKKIMSRHILHQHWYTCTIVLPVRRNPRNIEVFWMLSQPLPHLRFNVFVISETTVTQLWRALRDKHFPPQTGNVSLWISSALSLFAHEKRPTKERCSSVEHPWSTVAILTTETSLWTCGCACVT